MNKNNKGRVDLTNEALLISFNLPIYKNFKDISDSLGISGNLLYMMLKEKDRFYKKIEINKKNGGKRIIYKPSFSLKMIQKYILREILEKIKISNEAFAFRKNKPGAEIYGIKGNALKHKTNLYFYEIDIKEFFPSIKKIKIFTLFKNIGYNIKVSNILAELCTVNGILPQGSVTAPYLSNLVCNRLDYKIKEVANQRGLTYTRYADDLTFSSNDLEELKNSREQITEILSKDKFSLNRKKTRLIVPGNRVRITGITLENKKIYVKKDLKKKLRSLILKYLDQKIDKIDLINGYISYIKHIEDKDGIEGIKRQVSKMYMKVSKSIEEQGINMKLHPLNPENSDDLRVIKYIDEKYSSKNSNELLEEEFFKNITINTYITDRKNELEKRYEIILKKIEVNEKERDMNYIIEKNFYYDSMVWGEKKAEAIKIFSNKIKNIEIELENNQKKIKEKYEQILKINFDYNGSLNGLEEIEEIKEKQKELDLNYEFLLKEKNKIKLNSWLEQKLIEIENLKIKNKASYEKLLIEIEKNFG